MHVPPSGPIHRTGGFRRSRFPAAVSPAPAAADANQAAATGSTITVRDAVRVGLVAVLVGSAAAWILSRLVPKVDPPTPPPASGWGAPISDGWPGY